MKVKDLIAKLSQFPPEADLVIPDADSGGYDVTLYLDADVEWRELSHAPYRVNPNAPYPQHVTTLPAWSARVLALVGRTDLWDESNHLGGSPFTHGGGG